jgi:hypothetical protein
MFRAPIDWFTLALAALLFLYVGKWLDLLPFIYGAP